MSIQVDLRGFEAGFAELLAGLRNGAHQALVAAVKAAHESAASTTLFKDGPTARLRRSIRFEFDGPFAGMVKAGGADAPYGRFVNDGTPPHRIVAKGGGALRFVTSDGRTVFRRAVFHPGTAPRPFMARAAAVGEQALDYGLDYFTERPIAHFNRGE